MKNKLLQEKKYNELTINETEEVLVEAQKLVNQMREIAKEMKEMKERGVSFTGGISEELRDDIIEVISY